MNRHVHILHMAAFAAAALVFSLSIAGAQTVLVDFGSNAGANTFGLAGWNTLLKSGDIAYAADGPGGLVADISSEEYSDFMGVRGTSRQFTTSDRIVVTWYNRSTEVVRFTARVSFTDADQPEGGSTTGIWYTMRSAEDYRETWTELGPGETGRTMFAVRDHGVHKTDGSFDLVNINCAIEWGAADQKRYLVCDKIELFEDADTTPPSAPAGLTATRIADSQVDLRWDAATDNVGVVEYLVYVNGEIEGYSRENTFTCVYLEPDKPYRIAVTALDMMANESARSAELPFRTARFSAGKTLIQPEGVRYLGAMRMPDDFQWGGEALAYNVHGDGGPTGTGASDGYAGSLFVTNLNQPENGLVGEVGIPAISSSAASVEELPVAAVLQNPVNIRPSDINGWDYVDIWRTGLEYLPAEQRLYSSWSIHYTVGGGKHASISCCPASNLASGPFSGAWYVGAAAQPPIDAQMNDWLFALPAGWAATHCEGRQLVVGRCRDGGLSGLGPTLYAISPAGSAPPAQGTVLPFTTLLEYGPVSASDNYHFPDAVDGYKHSDDWREACWLAAEGQSAVAMIGSKAHGDNWYGYHGERMHHDWVIADVPYPEFDATDPDGKGWRAHRLSPMIILYNPADLAAVAAGSMDSHEPQPYGAVRIDESIFFGADHEIFSAAYDAGNHLLYVTEFVREADGALVIHAFRINDVATDVTDAAVDPPQDSRLEAHPNPFTATTTISYSLRDAGPVSLRIYDMLGRVVAVLVRNMQTAGTHAVSFAPAQLPAGQYHAILTTADGVRMQPLVWTK